MPEERLPRKLAAILYADVAGYSRLTAEDEEGTHRRLSGALDAIAAVVSALRGRVVHYAGDAVLADFASVTDALTCSVLIQRSLRERNAALPEDQRLNFRIGVNLGEVIDDRGDIYGDGVNIAARLETLADPGGICVSNTVRAAVGRRVPVEFEDLGSCEVKNIPEPVHAWQVRDRGLETTDEGGREGVVLLGHARAYTLLMGEENEADARAALDRCRELVVANLEERGGRVVQTAGDTVAAVFDDPHLGIDCAIHSRTAIAQANAGLPETARVHYRFGVAFGQVVEGRDGLRGDAAERAARLIGGARTDDIRLDDACVGQLPAQTELSLVEIEPGEHGLVEEPSPERSPNLPPQLDGLDIPLPDTPSVCLLPFSCLGDDPEGAALADGLRLDIQNALVKLSGLLLIAAGTANAFRGSPGERVAPQLGARHVLEGTVQRAGQRARVSVDLTDTQTSTVVWSERYNRTLDDTFALQDEITEHVVTALDVKLSGGDQARIWRKCLTDARARDHFYSGMHQFFQMSAESNARARACFERVAALAPHSPMGPTWLALCYWFEATRNWSDDVQASRHHAGEWAERAVTSEDADGQAQTVLGNVRLLEGRYDEALSIARDAVKVRPGCTNANGFLANVLLYCGECDDAVVHVKRAIRLSPVYPPWFLEILAAAHRDAGQVGFAISVAREVLRIAPGSIHGRALLAGALARSGSTAEARRIGGQIVGLDPGFSSTRHAEALPYRDRAVVARIVDDLRVSGLPD